MDYNKIFSPETISKLDKKSTDNLRQMLGDKTLTQTVMSSQKLLSDIAKAEAPYKSQLEKLAVDMVKELYPIIDEEGIVLDAKLTDISGVNSELNEIRVNDPTLNKYSFFPKFKQDLKKEILKEFPITNEFINEYPQSENEYGNIKNYNDVYTTKEGTTRRLKLGFPHFIHFIYGEDIKDKVYEIYKKVAEKYRFNFRIDNNFTIYFKTPNKIDEIKINNPTSFETLKRNLIKLIEDAIKDWVWNDEETLQGYFDLATYKEKHNNPLLQESITPESRRRIINGITQGAALRGAFSFYLFKEHLDEIDPTLVDKYSDIMKNSFGIYDDPNAVAMMLSLLAQGHKAAGGSSKVIIKEIKVNNPSIVDLSVDDEEDTWVDIDKVKKYLLPKYPKEEDRIEEYVEEINDGGDPDVYKKISIQELIKDFLQWMENNELNEIKVNDPTVPDFLKFPLNLEIRNPETYDKISPILEKMGYKWGRNYSYLKPTEVNPWRQRRFDSLDNNLAIGVTGLHLREEPGKILAISGISKKEYLYETENSGITIKARAICFPMLVHELIKGLYEVTSLQGFKGDKAANQAVVDKVDKLENEPNDIKYGKFVYDALNNVFASSKYSDPRIREFFFIDVYKLSDDEFISFIENAINETLTPGQLKWVDQTLKEISDDLKADDYDATGIGEIKINNPSIKSQLIKFIDGMIESNNPNISKIATIFSKHGKGKGFNEWLVSASGPEMYKFFDEIQPFLNTKVDEIKLNEYSDKTIQTTIERWKKENPKVDDNLAKQIIQRFDQIKSGLAQKLQIVSLSDELKKGNNYLNIDKYSFEDMVKLIRSLPENPDKIKKDAINKFVDKEGIDRNLAQSYVARFMAKKDALKYGFNSGLEDIDMKAEDIKKLVPKHLHMNDAYLNPNSWKWEPFEQILDALFPSQKQHGEVTNDVTTDADKVYSKNGLEIYKGDDVHKCISYNPANVTKGATKYGWCVTQPGNPNYDGYRFEERAPTFYFIFDRNKTSERNVSSFEDKWHAFVLQVNGDGKSYVVTAADNRGDEKVKSWEEISTIVPADTWAKIKDLKDVFKPIALSPVERGRKFASGKTLSLDEFKDLTQDEKIMYIQGKASKNALGDDILKILSKYKIEYEGRSTTLANIAIDSGQKFPYSSLKESEALAKRYAIFRFRHTNYSKDPIPLPYVKYLDDEAKEKYLKTFDDNLNFEYIEKFFGPKLAEEYVNKQIKTLDYLPPQAAKYIKDPKLKRLFEVYSKLFSSWKFGSDFNISDEELEKKSDMPTQDVTPIPINEKQWKDLTPQDRKVIIDLAGKVNKNDKYLTLLYALPFVIKDGDKSYVLVPKNNNDYSYNDWVIMDENGKELKNNISGESTLAGTTLTAGYPDSSDGFNRIYDLKDLKIK